MGIELETVVNHPLSEVFEWHTRPGAMRRLVPPWQPMKVVAEADSLADGRAVLGLPGGLRWVAQHDPTRFDAPHRFVDVLSSEGLRSWPPRIVGRWTHTHEFEESSSVRRGCTTASTRRCPRPRCDRCSPTGTGSSPTIWPPTGTPVTRG